MPEDSKEQEGAVGAAAGKDQGSADGEAGSSSKPAESGESSSRDNSSEVDPPASGSSGFEPDTRQDVEDDVRTAIEEVSRAAACVHECTATAADLEVP